VVDAGDGGDVADEPAPPAEQPGVLDPGDGLSHQRARADPGIHCAREL
jgi:hypothetical protein